MGVSGISIWQIFIMLFILLPLFLLPTIVAVTKNHPHKIPIILVNIFGSLLWGIGWLVALIWSFILPQKVPSAPSSAASEIEKLHQLMEKGVITQAEFDQKKSTLLNM